MGIGDQPKGTPGRVKATPRDVQEKAQRAGQARERAVEEERKARLRAQAEQQKARETFDRDFEV
ncbi:hypothetical protein [Streptomyces sp. SAJ15]|uniref:hypothetical protein n=1 Tax=Streptomyces sp. SAJ15 TaxID=2011095 RepID=UPI001186438D|nr:hypothetical protein [Streptomyces sp. SAJ15]TVL91561.1 hypothetical protein CD790_16575 [Streptomyces sp. SAJ15]